MASFRKTDRNKGDGWGKDQSSKSSDGDTSLSTTPNRDKVVHPSAINK